MTAGLELTVEVIAALPLLFNLPTIVLVRWDLQVRQIDG